MTSCRTDHDKVERTGGQQCQDDELDRSNIKPQGEGGGGGHKILGTQKKCDPYGRKAVPGVLSARVAPGPEEEPIAKERQESGHATEQSQNSVDVHGSAFDPEIGLTVETPVDRIGIGKLLPIGVGP